MTTSLTHGWTVVSPTGRQHLDVLIDGEKVVALLEPDST